ncbi:hypothetical protein H5410_004760 [Solanum commersonii]|uniref:Uncharacterized protein n=1 Tax=Solanum commersonii TaxID=4109 RepID=A0A9J6A4I0_SOLCO|nr:hypothetical protein H5410_004760 [Solanum commersonii]
MSIEAKAGVVNVIADNEGVDNLGMALYETVRSLLNGLRCRHLGVFCWYKDTYLSRVMELPENGLEHWKAKFIDGLPPLFAERVRKNSEESARCYSLQHLHLWKLNRSMHSRSLDYLIPPLRVLNIEILVDLIQKNLIKKEGLDEGLDRNGKSEKLIENLIDFQRIGLGENSLKLSATNIHNKIYSFLYTSSSESDYDYDSSSENEVDQPESSGNNQSATVDACKCQGDICYCENDEFYKLQSQFDDMNIYTITSDNVIELLKEVIANNLREKIIQFAINNKASTSNSFEKPKNNFEFEYSAPYSLYEVNNRLAKQLVVIRDTSFDDLKVAIENIKQEIKMLKQNKIICDHRITQIESVNSKGKNIAEENTLAKPINLDSRQNMFLGMMQIVTAHKWKILLSICLTELSAIPPL